MPPILAIVGRSNTGKSSLCRLLAPQFKKKIRVGKAPGVTRRINTYSVGEYTIHDLPGFGYMKHSSKKEEDMVKDEIIAFLETKADEIFLAIHVINLEAFRRIYEKYKHDSVPFDNEMLAFLLELEIPTVVLGNKVDKFKHHEREREMAFLKEKLIDTTMGRFPPRNIIPFSTRTREGLDALEKMIDMHLRRS